MAPSHGGPIWLDPLSVVLGLVEVAVYGLVAAAVAAAAWNFVVERATRRAA